MELKTYFAQDKSGNIIPNAIVSIFFAGTESLATGLTDAEGVAIGNPFTASSSGRVQFRAPDGIYDMQVSIGLTSGLKTTIQCVDYSDAKQSADIALVSKQDAQSAALTAQTAAESAQAISDGGSTYASTTAGLAATTSGQYFRVPQGTGSQESFIYYLNNSGLASPVANQVGKAAIDSQNSKIADNTAISNLLADVSLTEKTTLNNAGDYSITSQSIVKLSSALARLDNTGSDTLSLSVSQNDIVINEKLLPQEQINTGVKSSPYADVELSSRTNVTSVSDTNCIRLVMLIPNTTILFSRTTQYIVFDMDGIFNAEKQTTISVASVLSVSAHSSGGICVSIPKTTLTAGGYALTTAGAQAYINANYPNKKFKGLTLTSSSINVPSQFLASAGQVSVQKSGSGSISVDILSAPIKEEVTPVINTPSIKYIANVNNDLNETLTSELSSIALNFDIGMVPSEDCITLSDMVLGEIPCQWVPEAQVNYAFENSYGFYTDKSLRSGSIVFERSFSAKEKAYLSINAFQDKRKTRVKPELIASGSDKTLTVGNYTFLFSSTTGFQLASVTKAGITTALIYGVWYAEAYYDVSGYDLSMSSGFKSLDITAYGDVFTEVTGIFEFRNVRATTRYRFTATGKVFVDTTFLTLADIPGDTIYGLTGRMETYSPSREQLSSLMGAYWTDNGQAKSSHLLYCAGHIHRDGPQYELTLPVWSLISTQSTTNTRIYGGWMYRDKTREIAPIVADTAFAHGFMVNLAQTQSSLQPANDVARNLPVGFADTGIIERVSRKQLLTEILNYVDGRSDYWDKYFADNSIARSQATYAAHLALLKKGLSKKYTFDQIYSNFKVYIDGFGGSSNLASAYANNSLVLQFASRAILPNVIWFYKESLSINDTVKIADLKVMIASLADAMVTKFNASGFVPLQNSLTVANSNSNATAMRVLAIAIYLGTDASGNYLSTLNSLENLLKNSYALNENIFTESVNGVLATNQYLHYSEYAFHDYLRACTLLSRTPVVNMANYTMNAIASYGALREQIYCISNSRKGSSLTYAYAIYVMNTLGGLSGQSACKVMINHLKEQMNADNSQPRPLDDWPINMNTSAASPTPFELQALAEIILEDYYS